MEYRPHLKISYFSRWQFSRIFRKLYLPKSTDVFTICVSQSDRRLLTPSPHTSVAQTLPQFVSWIGRPLLVVFVSRGRNLIEGAGASKTTVSVLRARKKINYTRWRCEISCHDWCFNFVQERPARSNLWCLSGPAEKLAHWYRLSARGSTYDWQNWQSFLSILAQCGWALSLSSNVKVPNSMQMSKSPCLR